MTVAALTLEKTSCCVCGADQFLPEATGYDYIYQSTPDLMTMVRCTACGHIYLNPRPVQSEISRIYPQIYPSFSGRYASSGGLLPYLKDMVNLSRFRRIAQKLPPGARILDAGCGDGRLLLSISRRFPHLELFGLDWQFAPEVRDRLSGAGIGLHEICLEDFDQGSHSFDLVIMNQLIEHLWEPRLALRKLVRHLKEDGRILVATPNIDGYDRRVFRHGLWGGYYFPRHLNLFNLQSLTRLLRETGFDVEEFAGIVAPVVWSYSLRAWAMTRFPQASWLQQFLDIKNTALLGIATVIDIVAILLKMESSNLHVIAKRQKQ